MVEITYSDSGAATVVFGGDCTVQGVGEMHRDLLEVVRRASRLEVDVRAVARADLAFLQLLLALQHSLRQVNKELVAAGVPSEAFSAAVASAGMVRCLGNNDKSGLWIGTGD